MVLDLSLDGANEVNWSATPVTWRKATEADVNASNFKVASSFSPAPCKEF